jgi:hypothetical protein
LEIDRIAKHKLGCFYRVRPPFKYNMTLSRRTSVAEPRLSSFIKELNMKEKEVFGDLSAQSKKKSLSFVDCAV